MSTKKKTKRPVEFSKLILIVAAIINVVVIGFAIVMIWRTENMDVFGYLIPAVAAEVATGTGFYYSKAKVENRIKLMKHYKVEPTEESFSDEGGNSYG